MAIPRASGPYSRHMREEPAGGRGAKEDPESALERFKKKIEDERARIAATLRTPLPRPAPAPAEPPAPSELEQLVERAVLRALELEGEGARPGDGWRSFRGAMSESAQETIQHLRAELDEIKASLAAAAPGGPAPAASSADERFAALEAQGAALQQSAAQAERERDSFKTQAQKAKALGLELESAKADLAAAEARAAEELKSQRAIYESRLRQLKAQLDAQAKKAQEEKARADELSQPSWRRWLRGLRGG